MFLKNCTRPNIAYVVIRLSRYTHLAYKNWTALTCILIYLEGTMNLGYTYTGHPVLETIVMQIGYRIMMRSTPLVVMFSP